MSIAPNGPYLVSSGLFGEPDKLKIETRFNGESRWRVTSDKAGGFIGRDKQQPVDAPGQGISRSARSCANKSKNDSSVAW